MKDVILALLISVLSGSIFAAVPGFDMDKAVNKLEAAGKNQIKRDLANPDFRGEPGQKIWELFQAVKSSEESRKPFEVVGFRKSGNSTFTRHVQGVARLPDGRFVVAHSTFNNRGHWFIQRSRGLSGSDEFVFGEENHPSPLQASGYMVFAPLTRLGCDDCTCENSGELSLFILFDRAEPRAWPAPCGAFGTKPQASGVAYDAKRGNFYFSSGKNLYVQDASDSIVKVTVVGEGPDYGQGGLNLIYDGAKDRLYAFGFHNKGEQESYGGDTLTIQEYRLSRDGRFAKNCKAMDIDFYGLPFDTSPKGTSWKYGGGLRVNEDSIEIYKSDEGGSEVDNLNISVFRFPYRLIRPPGPPGPPGPPEILEIGGC